MENSKFNVSDASTLFPRLFKTLRTWFELSRVKLYRNDLRENKIFFEFSGWFELSRVRVAEGKITLNVSVKEIRGKSILVRVSEGSSYRESTVLFLS